MNKFLFWTVLSVALFLAEQSQAQSWKDIFKKENVEKAIGELTEKHTGSMEGTWNYTQPAIEFKSDKLLDKAGSQLAATAAEKKLGEKLKKYGIQESSLSFTFHNDSTFQARLNQRTMDGTFSYDKTTKLFNLKFNKLIQMDAKINCSSTNMDILFNSDKLLNLIIFLSKKSQNTTLKSLSSLAENYDGMMLGFSLSKEGYQPL